MLWVFVIVLASNGISLVGGIPIIPFYKKNTGLKLKTELYEPQKEEDDSEIPKILKFTGL